MTDFVHLHVHSVYSLLDGACRIKPLVAACKDAGMKALAITDHGVMNGVIEFYEACRAEGIKPILGCEVYTARRRRTDKEASLDSDYGHLILLAENDTGYKNLIKIVSKAFTEGYYYKPRVDLDLLREYHEGIICSSACLGGDVPQAILHGSYEDAKKKALEFRDIFGENNYFLELQSNGLEEQILVNQNLIKLSKETGIPLICTNDVHFINRSDAKMQDYLMCIQTGKKYDDEDRMRFNTDEVYFRSPEEMASLFADVPEALENTCKIAERCNVSFEMGKSILPDYKIPDGMTPGEYLSKLCYDGAAKLYGNNLSDEIKERIEYELSIIIKMGYDKYYLIVWDYIHFAKTNGIMVGPGRGSGAGSIVAYCIGITTVDPMKYNLAFERFLNPERVSMPDFDVDFDDVRRKEVIEYIRNTYGDDKVAQIITFGTFAARGVIRDVGRVMNLPYNDVDVIAKMIPKELDITIDKALESNPELKAKYESDPQVKTLIDMAKELEGMPRNIGTHAAGVVMTLDPVTDYVPLELSKDATVTQFPMKELEKLGLLKVDILGLRTLTVLKNCLELIEENYGKRIDLQTIDYDDPKPYKTISDGLTSGVFQLESPGMTKFMMDLKPSSVEDIIAGIALYRPGPMQFIPRYLENKKNPDNVKYDHELLKPVLGVTYGCMIYQEQVMQIFRDLAGYTMGQSDMVRRAMAKKKHDVLAKERTRFVEGSKKNGVPEETADKLFDEMTEFSKYAFNKAHAACYAVVGYQTAWLKTYYPVEFMAATLNSFIDRTDKIAEYTVTCQLMGIEILPPDINLSRSVFSVDNGKIRFALTALKTIGYGPAELIEDLRYKDGPFKSFGDFIRRVAGSQVNKRCIENFIKSGAMDCFGLKRSQMLAVYETMLDDATANAKNAVTGQISLFDMFADDSSSEIEDKYPDLNELDHKVLMKFEKESTGMYLSSHPMKEYEEKLSSLRNVSALDLRQAEDDEDISSSVKDNMDVVTGGIITNVRKKTTKNNTMMAFVTIEDLYGIMELLIFPKTYEKFSGILLEDNIVLVKGRLSLREDDTPKIIPENISFIDDEKAEDTGIISFSISDADVDRLRAFCSYFSGNTKVTFRSKETNNVIFTENINLNDRILSNLKATFNC